MALRLLDDSNTADAIQQISSADLVAIDTEFHAEKAYLPALYLVQIHVPDGGDTWIVDPKQTGRLESLTDALLGGVTWLMHAGEQDLRLLQAALGGVAERTLDVQVAAGLVTNHYPTGLGRIVEEWLDIRLPKSETLSDWSRRPLSDEQLRYAAEDVVLLPDLWEALKAALVEAGRLEIALGAFADYRSEAVDPPTADQLWRPLAISNSLVPRNAAILRELVVWREAHAKRVNRPARFVLGESAMKQLSRSQPRTRAQLASNRRLAKSLLQRNSDELLAVIAAGAAVAEEDWPATVRAGTAAHRVVTWLGLFGDVEGARLRYATRLVLPRVVREDIALAGARDRALIASILGPWRDALVGDRVAAALRGNVSVRLQSSEGGLDTELSTSDG
jgi:ribonuclease D